ncbi:L,D-transpeptidase family protein [Sediminibacterium soli]|uniref:L,D-transpeptidase family protein n=1 Tax=Sediminibacterium soli TaxID=2698829 RepID=UPI001F2612AC|nr:L,D-transpeptidase [Sediminibacterium soli]
MKPNRWKPALPQLLRGVFSLPIFTVTSTKAPWHWPVAFTHSSLRKMRTPFYVSLLGMVVITSTSFKKKLPLVSKATRNSYYVLVTKSKYELKVFDSTGEWIVTYPVVFGNKDLGDKMMEGDRKTPEGVFHIAGKRKHEKWNSFMMLDYPTQESVEKFNRRKAAGMIPSGARIGGAIGIHGTWPNEDYAIDQYQNWTEGCISTKNNYIREIFELLPVGTKIEIRR